MIRSIYLYIYVCAIIVLTGCGKTPASTDNVFLYNESNGISTLDPAFARDLEIMWASNQLFDGLVELDEQMHIVPCIAKSWEISDDGLSYTFHLRSDVKFHKSELFEDPENRMVRASDFVYSFNRIQNPELASPGQWIFAKVDTNAFTAADDTTLIIRLKEPFVPFLGMLTTQYCNVVPHEVVTHFGADFRSNPIGTGPFQFAFWYENVALVFHKNPQYWQKDELGNSLPYLDAVKIDFAKDMSVEFRGLIQGTYDFVSGIHPAYKDELLNSNGELAEAYSDQLYFQKTPFIKTDYLGIVVDESLEVNKNSPLLDPRVRAAIHAAINKKEMVEFLRNNTVFPAGNLFVPPALRTYHDTVETFDLKKSQQLLSEAGYPLGEGLPEFAVATTSDYADLMEYIQFQLQQAGIRLNVQVMQGATFREASAKNQLQVFRKSWLADYADPENFLSIFHSGNFSPKGPNYTHFRNDRFDELYNLCTQTSNDSLRQSYFLEMESLVIQETPLIPLYYDQVSHFIRKEISQFPTNPVNMLDLKKVKKKKKG